MKYLLLLLKEMNVAATGPDEGASKAVCSLPPKVLSVSESDPLPFKITYPTSVEEHERLSQMPLTTEKERRMERHVPTLEPKPVPIDSEEDKRRLAVLERLLARKKDLESWEAA